MKLIRVMVASAGLMFLCSCATPGPIRPALPAETAFNQGAGRGDFLFVTLRLEDGEKLLFMVDTGRPNTVLDKSLEPKLGKRLGRKWCWEPFLGGLITVGTYAAPKLYLGNTRLVTGTHIYTCDWQRLSPGLKGILGMDCLRHYCVQFDFEAGKVRFLDPDLPPSDDWGQAFPLTILFGVLIADADFFGTGNMYFCPDTGCNVVDAMLKPKWLRRELQKQKPVWTSQITAPTGRARKMAGFSKGIFGGATYTNLTFMEWPGTWPDGDLIGLPFLARNLVTFNFPRRIMYLKQTTGEPLDPTGFITMEAGTFLESLYEKGQLPGYPKDTNQTSSTTLVEAHSDSYPLSRTFKVQIGGQSWVDVTPKVKSLVAGGASRIFANNDLAGRDPAPYIVKQLYVTFRLHGRQRTVRATEGGTLALPAGVEVVTARYGKLPAQTANRSQKTGDTSAYHYSVVRTSRDSPWKLQKTWRTDADGRLIEEYTVP